MKTYSATFRVSAAVLTLLCPTTVLAADKALLDILLGNGAIDQAQYDELLAKDTLETEDVVNIGFADGSGLKVTSADGDFELEIGGRLQADAVTHSYDPRIGTDPISGTQVRRGRIELDGVFSSRWGYAAEFDFAKNEVR